LTVHVPAMIFVSPSAIFSFTPIFFLCKLLPCFFVPIYNGLHFLGRFPHPLRRFSSRVRVPLLLISFTMTPPAPLVPPFAPFLVPLNRASSEAMHFFRRLAPSSYTFLFNPRLFLGCQVGPLLPRLSHDIFSLSGSSVSPPTWRFFPDVRSFDPPLSCLFHTWYFPQAVSLLFPRDAQPRSLFHFFFHCAVCFSFPLAFFF